MGKVKEPLFMWQLQICPDISCLIFKLVFSNLPLPIQTFLS